MGLAGSGRVRSCEEQEGDPHPIQRKKLLRAGDERGRLLSCKVSPRPHSGDRQQNPGEETLKKGPQVANIAQKPQGCRV